MGLASQGARPKKQKGDNTMFIVKCSSFSGIKDDALLIPATQHGVSLQRVGCKVLILGLLLCGLSGFLGAQNWEGGDWDGGTIPIFDDHKSDQRQAYPDELEYLHHMIKLGPLGPTVDGVVIIDAEEITEVMLKWNQMHNEKNLDLARTIYADQVDFYNNHLSKTSLISNLQRQFNQQHRNYSQGITQISGRRAGNTRVQIDLYCDHIAANYGRNPHRMILERNRTGWQIISENFLPYGFSDFYVQDEPVSAQEPDTNEDAEPEEMIESMAPVDTLDMTLYQRGDSLLENGDFTYGTHGWNTVDFTSGARTQLRRENNNFCVMLSHESSGDWNAIGQEIRYKLKQGTLYEIHLRYKSDCANDQVPLLVRFGDPQLLMHSSIIAPFLDGQFAINDNTWSEATGYFRAGADHPNASEPMLDIIFNYGSAGTIWLDDISLREAK